MTQPMLFTPISLRGVTFKNRIMVAPMCQYQAVEGRPQEWHFAHHSRFALGGVGSTVVEATGVTRDGRISPGCTGIWEDGQIPGFRRITDLYRSQGVVSGIQLGHAGRKASTARPWDGAGPLPAAGDPAWVAVGPSALPAREGWPPPRALETDEIPEIVEAFRTAAVRSLEAGFDFVEIHGAHGYLLHSFFSPLSNERTDEFGGDLEGRMRLPVMVAEAIRTVWPDDRPVLYRASVIDGVDGGITVEDTIALARALKTAGVDAIDCSSGGLLGSVSITNKLPPQGFQVPLAEAVRQGADMPTIAVGMITEASYAEEVVRNGQADFVAIAREFIADPVWSYRAAQELGREDPHGVLPFSYAFYLRRRAELERG
jgi:2,4-dienoyl-CoA reductase-like NADH-dependent reductase (Old Yellow Enzyme family)